MTNVTRLPTAARRKVEQPTNKAARAVRQRMREEQPWPGEYIDPNRRKAMDHARKIREAEQTPALMIAAAIYAALSEEQRERVRMQLAPTVIAGSETAMQAMAILSASAPTVGLALDLDWAFRRLREEALGHQAPAPKEQN